MPSLILRTAARYLLPLLLIFSVFVLLRGHAEPGGGFIGGLVAAAAFVLYGIAYNVQSARAIVRVSNRTLIGVGLLFAAFSALLPTLFGEPALTGLWLPLTLPAIGKIGTPLSFDVGVYLVVIGVVLTIVFTLAEEQEFSAETSQQEADQATRGNL